MGEACSGTVFRMTAMRIDQSGRCSRLRPDRVVSHPGWIGHEQAQHPAPATRPERMDTHVGTREPTQLGWWLMRAMAARDLSQTDLAKLIDTAQGTISRLIYERRKFDLDMLRRLADTFNTPYGDVLALAGYTDVAGAGPAQPQPEPDDELLAKLRLMLDRSSPIPPAQLDTLRTVLAGVIAPYEQYMTRRRRAG